jgi:hypothetical protein
MVGWRCCSCSSSHCRCCLPPHLVVPDLVAPRFPTTSSCSRRRLGVMWWWPSQSASSPHRCVVVGGGAGSSLSSLSVCRCSSHSSHPPRKQRLAAAVTPHPHPRFVVVVRPVGRRLLPVVVLRVVPVGSQSRHLPTNHPASSGSQR